MTNPPNMDGEGGQGRSLQDVIRLTIPQAKSLLTKPGGPRISSDEARRRAHEAYRKDPEGYRKKMQEAIEKARRSVGRDNKSKATTV